MNGLGKAILKDVGLYKNKLLSTILNDQDLCEAMLIGTDYNEENIDKLIYTQVFPYLYADETQTEVLPYTCFEVVPIYSSGTIKKMKIIFWVYCHKDCMKYSKKGFAGTRSDILSDIITRILLDDKNFGIGKLEFSSADYFFPSSKYYGRQIILYTSDFKVKDV